MMTLVVLPCCVVFSVLSPMVVGQLSPVPLIFTWTCCRVHSRDPTPGPFVLYTGDHYCFCFMPRERDATSWFFLLVANDR